MDANPLAIILFHKQSTSARVRFLLAENSSICFATEIPALATLVEENQLSKDSTVDKHPATAVGELEQQMGLAKGDIELVKDFSLKLDVPNQVIPVYLGYFKNIDPPFDEVATIGAKFIAITEARRLPPVELQLLQKAYQYLMG